MITQAHPYRLGRKEFSLGKNRNYQYVYRKGKSFPSHTMVLVYVPAKELRVGFSASSKVGNAVTRNHVRRVMKEDFRKLRPSLKEGKYIFVARVCAGSAPHGALTANMRALVVRAGLMKEGSAANEEK